MRLLNKSGANPTIALTYVQYGQWRRVERRVGRDQHQRHLCRVRHAHAGERDAEQWQRNYTTHLDGTFVNKNGVYAVAGAGGLTANFGAGTISYNATLTGTREGGGTNIAFGALNGSGSLSLRGASFNGSGTTNGSGYKLDVNGHFYGPAAQEVGGIFRLTGNNGNGVGAIVGKQ